MHLCRVGKIYCCHASPAHVDIQMSDDLSYSSKDVPLEILIQQIGRRIDDEYNVSHLTTLYDRFCHKLNFKKHLTPSLIRQIIKSVKYNKIITECVVYKLAIHYQYYC